MTDPVATAETQANAKATADATVATDPHAVHAVNTAPTSPKALSSAAVGAGAGFMLGGPPGALVGAGVGWLVEHKRIAGGPVGKAWDWIQAKREGLMHKKAAAAPGAPHPSAPAVPPPAAK